MGLVLLAGGLVIEVATSSWVTIQKTERKILLPHYFAHSFLFSLTMTMTTMMMKLLFVLMTTMIFWGLLLLSSSVVVVVVVHAEIDAMTGVECVDNHDQCGFWAATGECTKNPKYMGEYCRLSCDKCRVVRLGSANDINAFLASKKGEIEAKMKEIEAMKALKAKEAEVLNALQGSEQQQEEEDGVGDDDDTDDNTMKKKKKEDDDDKNNDDGDGVNTNNNKDNNIMKDEL